jgi:hypothetical protein
VEKIALQCGCNSTGPCRCEVAQQLADFLSTKLPAANHYLLAYVFLHAQQIILNADTNKMNLMALGTLLQQIFNLSSREVRIFLLNASSLLLKEGDDPVFIKHISAEKRYLDHRVICWHSFRTVSEFKRLIRLVQVRQIPPHSF